MVYRRTVKRNRYHTEIFKMLDFASFSLERPVEKNSRSTVEYDTSSAASG